MEMGMCHVSLPRVRIVGTAVTTGQPAQMKRSRMLADYFRRDLGIHADPFVVIAAIVSY